MKFSIDYLNSLNVRDRKAVGYADTIHTVINTNWDPVIRDIAPVAFEQIIKACVDETKKLFAAVSVNELLVPYDS